MVQVHAFNTISVILKHIHSYRQILNKCLYSNKGLESKYFHDRHLEKLSFLQLRFAIQVGLKTVYKAGTCFR